METGIDAWDARCTRGRHALSALPGRCSEQIRLLTELCVPDLPFPGALHSPKRFDTATDAACVRPPSEDLRSRRRTARGEHLAQAIPRRRGFRRIPRSTPSRRTTRFTRKVSWAATRQKSAPCPDVLGCPRTGRRGTSGAPGISRWPAPGIEDLHFFHVDDLLPRKNLSGEQWIRPSVPDLNFDLPFGRGGDGEDEGILVLNQDSRSGAHSETPPNCRPRKEPGILCAPPICTKSSYTTPAPPFSLFLTGRTLIYPWWPAQPRSAGKP